MTKGLKGRPFARPPNGRSVGPRCAGALTHSARRVSWFGAERNGRRQKAECPSWPLPAFIFYHPFFVRHPYTTSIRVQVRAKKWLGSSVLDSRPFASIRGFKCVSHDQNAYREDDASRSPEGSFQFSVNRYWSTVRRNNHAVSPASDRFAAQASPVLPGCCSIDDGRRMRAGE